MFNQSNIPFKDSKELNKQLAKHAKAYGIQTFIDFDEIDPNTIDKLVMSWDVPLEWFNNNSYIVGKEELVLGFYGDKEKKAISFWHEIGHLLNSYNKDFRAYNEYIEEIEATLTGIKQAHYFGFEFSDSAVYWLIQQANNCLSKKLSNRRKNK